MEKKSKLKQLAQEIEEMQNELLRLQIQGQKEAEEFQLGREFEGQNIELDRYQYKDPDKQIQDQKVLVPYEEVHTLMLENQVLQLELNQVRCQNASNELETESQALKLRRMKQNRKIDQACNQAHKEFISQVKSLLLLLLQEIPSMQYFIQRRANIAIQRFINFIRNLIRRSKAGTT